MCCVVAAVVVNCSTLGHCKGVERIREEGAESGDKFLIIVFRQNLQIPLSLFQH